MKAYQTIASIWTWLSIAAVALVGAPLQALVAIIARPFDPNRKAAGRFFRRMGYIASRLAPTWHFGVHGEYPRRLNRPTVVVSNHASNADIFLIAHLPWEMKWLGKQSLFKIPVMGSLMRRAGDIPIIRGCRSSVERAMKICADYLVRGVPVCFFPEGTRSRTGELGPFKDGAFLLAIKTGADILPLAIAGTDRALPKQSWLFGTARAFVTVGTPIRTTGMTPADVGALKAAAREQIEQKLNVLRRLIAERT